MTEENPSTKQLALFQDITFEEYDRGKDELNVIEFPLALAGKTPRQAGKATLEFQDVITDKSTNKPVQRTLTIAGSEKWGLPTYYDEEVLFGLIQVANLQRVNGIWPEEIRFSRYQLARLLGLKTDGRTYRRLWDSLHRLATTSYAYQYAWFEKENAEWQPSIVFNFIQTLTIRGSQTPGKNGDISILWNSHIHQSFQAGFLRNIDFAEYRAISLPLAKALFRFLGKHFWKKKSLTFNVQVLAFEKLGLSRKYNIGAIKRALAPAIERLEERRFIKKVPRLLRYEKLKPGVWNIHFELYSPADEGQGNLELKPVEKLTALESRLVGHGLAPETAKELVGKQGEARVLRDVEHVEHLIATGKGPREVAAWLMSAIKRVLPYELPKDFKDTAQRAQEAAEAKKRMEARIARRKKERVTQEQKRALEDEARKKDELKVNMYLDAISSEERSEVERMALVGWRNPSELVRAGLIQAYVLKLIKNK